MSARLRINLWVNFRDILIFLGQKRSDFGFIWMRIWGYLEEDPEFFFHFFTLRYSTLSVRLISQFHVISRDDTNRIYTLYQVLHCDYGFMVGLAEVCTL